MSGIGPDKAYIFRITHLSNIPWILDHGVHCKNSQILDPSYCEIGSADLIEKRNHRPVPIAPFGTLSDYVPFYFTPYSPMMYKIKTGHEVKKTPLPDIVILVSSLPQLKARNIEFVFSDRHAYLQAANYYSELSDLNCIDWKTIRSRDFKRDPNDPGRHERYQAEALIYQHLPIAALAGLACYGKKQEENLKAELECRGISLKIVVKPEWYL